MAPYLARSSRLVDVCQTFKHVPNHSMLIQPSSFRIADQYLGCPYAPPAGVEVTGDVFGKSDAAITT